MSDVFNEIRSYASTEGTGSASTWGTAPGRVPALASTRFPAGAVLTIRGLKTVLAPETIGTAESDKVRVPTAGTPSAQWPLARSLEDVIAVCRGSLLDASASGLNTLVFRILDETPTDPLYSRTVDYRVAFDPTGNKARFTRSNRLASNGSPANFQLLLDTTYTVEQVGDARVMRFAAMPAAFEASFGYAFRLAERGGQVWYATQSNLPVEKVNWAQRLNGPAWDAVRAVLSIQ